MKKIIFFLLIIIFSNLVKAGQEPVIRQFMTGNAIAVDSNRKVEDPVYIAGQLNNYQLYKCYNYINLEINQDQISQCFFDTFSFWVEVEFKGWDKNGVLTTKIISLNVTYDQRNGMEYKGIHTEKLEHFYKTEIKILSHGNSAYRSFVKVSLEMAIERYRMINLTTIPTFNAITLNSTDGNIIFSWPHIIGAEEYDFEYTYIDDYKYVSGNDYYDSSILSKSLNELYINFNKNASRITTKANSVSIPNVFDRGYLVARFRAVTYTGAKFDHRITGRWSNESHGNRADQFVNNQEIFFVNSLEPTLNWQLVTTFAEEGKTKQVVSFMDGAYRSRQNITRISSDSTVIAAETIYDFQGRPAIQVLPVPLDNKKLEYYPDLNTDENTGTNYSAEHFDIGDCFVPSNAMVASSGAAKYYSANNEFLNNPNHYLSEHNPYIPNALKYPFTRTLYTPDNSGRVSIQSGVGRDHKIGSGHETRYYYGTPFQEELDRLFGNDVGFAKHYEKEMVVDPNGQVSVSYKDLSGKVIATALAGVTPSNVAKLSNNDNERELEVKLESSTETNLQDDFGLEITKSISVPLPTQYRISYSVLLDEFTKDCWTDCAECVYDLEVSIKDECGQEVVDGDPKTSGNQPIIRRLKKGTTGNFELDCGNLRSYSFINDPDINDTLRVNLLVGSYTLTKKIVVSNQAAEFFAQEYLNNATCLKTREDFVDYYSSIVDDFGCYISCDSCQELLEDKGAYIASRITVYVGQGFSNDTALYNLVEEEYNQKLKICNSICNADIPNCDYYKNILISDVSAGGQYQYLEGDITKHPEYCDYQYCLATNQAQNFEHYLDNVDYREALQNGLFDPLKTKGGTYPQGVYDTFFFEPANAALKTALINRINNFVSISGGAFRSIWDLAIFMSNEDLNGVGAFGDAAIYEVISKYNHATRCLDKDVFLWQAFRSFYKMARKEILDNHKNANQCSTKIIPSGKERRFLTNDQITLLGPGTSETNQNNYFLETCQTYCDSMSYMWMQQIGDCVKNHPNWEQIRLGLVDVCQSSCGEDNPLGASANPALNKSFKNVLAQYNVYDKHNCNPEVINFMPPSTENPLPISLSEEQLHCLCKEPNNPCMNNVDPDFYLIIKELKAFNDNLECEDFCYSCSEVREQIDAFNLTHPESKNFIDSTKNWGGILTHFLNLKLTLNLPVDQYFAFMAECNGYDINAKDYQEIYNEFLLFNRKHLLGQPEYDDSVKSVILSKNVDLYKNYFEENPIRYASIENNFFGNSVNNKINSAASGQVTLNACGCASIFSLINDNADLKDPDNEGWDGTECNLPNIADIMYLCQTAFLSTPNANLEDMGDINNWDANQILEVYNLGRSHDIFIPCECLAGDNGNPLCDCGTLPGEGFGEIDPVVETPVLPCDSLVKYVDSFVKLNPQLFSAYSKPYPEDVALLIAKYVDSVFSGDPYHRDVVENTTFMTENEYRLERLLGQIELCTGTRGKQGGPCEIGNPLFSVVRSYFECTECKSGNKNAESALLWLRQESKLIKDSIANIPGRLSLMRVDGHNLSSEDVNGYIYTELYSGFSPLVVNHNYAVSPMSSFINTNKYLVTDGPNTVELFLNFLAPDKKYSSFSNIRGVRFLQPYNFTSCLKENRFVVEVLVEFKSYSDPSKTKMIILPMFGKVVNKDLMDTCKATPLLCGKKSTIYAPKLEAPPCGYDFDALINSWADDAYKIYQDSIKEQFVLDYKTHCLNRAKTTEQAKIRFKTQEYHYTLYYYDLAGNLIQTVPPKGVVMANASQITQTSNARKGTASPFYNVHQLKTHYMYNTLNQLKWQVTPDGGVSDFWYDKLGRLVISRNAKQKAKTKPTYSYTIYDALGRITEVGEVNKAILNDTMTFQIAYSYDLFLNYVKQGTRTEVTKTFYDNEVYAISYGDWDQENLRSRVVSTIYQNAGNDDYNLYDHAVHYDYDIHGNVKRMLRDNRSMDSIFQRYKRIDYVYELVSGNVNMVKYQPDSLDQFYHKYAYDADNRIVSAFTSRDLIHWDEDAHYKYYLHGPLARTEIGELNVQGMDYAYTIQGWIKGVNSERLRPSHDIGKDGFTGNNQWFAKDVFGYGLGYFQGDYQAIGSISSTTHFIIDRQGSTFQGAANNLYNGNISWMVTAISKFMGQGDIPFARAFGYDQLNRLISSRVYDNLDTTLNKWKAAGPALNAYATDYTYDANGNILTLNRNGKASTPNMDQLTYYYKNNTNQLVYVDDAVSAANYGVDIDDQSNNNYLYDQIGNLIRDASEEIDSIYWTVYGKIWRIKRITGSLKPDIHFEYSPDGHRVAKHVRDAETKLLTSTWYIRDAQGNVMATYAKTGYLDLDTVNLPHHIITNIVVAENGNDVFANFLAYHMNLPLFMTGTDFTNLKSMLLGAGLMETALRGTSPVDIVINNSITFGQVLNTVPTLALFDAMSAYFGSNLAAIQQLCNNPSCKITLAQHMYTADFDAFMPILFQTDLMKAQTVWSTFMAGPMPPNMNVAVATLKANVNFQLLLRTIVDVFDCNYVLAQYLVFKGPIAFRNQIGTYADLKNCYRNVFGDYFLANIMDLYDRQLLWTHMFATHPAGFWADLLISVNPIEFGRIAFKYFPNEANQLMINANISITDYFSLIESYPGLGNAYLSNLKNTLMNMGYTAAGWTYLADEHHIYGSSRVGVHNTHFVLAKRFSTAEMEYTQKTGNQVHFIRGKRNYELSNHLGNVQVVISDKRISVCDNELQTERFEADILMATDYYPFGMAIPERQWYTGSDSSNYRFGFNGKEIDREHGGAGNSYDYGFRVYNPTLGRFLSVDPLCRTYPWYSPYQFAGNKPIWAIDVDGLEEYIYQYSIDDNLNVVLIKKETNVEMREKINPSGLHSGIYEAYNKKTGEKLTDDERGKVQYEYFYKGKKIDIHRELNGDFAEGAGEMMSLHQENYDGSIYISSPFGKDAMVGNRYDYRREPTDLADAAALSHDKAYDKVNAAGTWDALTNPETILADIQLLVDVQKIIDNYGNKDFVDPYTNKPISEQTYNRAQTIKTIFTGIVINKIKNSATTP